MARLREFHQMVDEISDEGVGLDDDDTRSVSIKSTVFDYIFENGRRYHRYHAGSYPLPNDDLEQARLKLCHHLWSAIMNERLCKMPLHNPQRILDIGCGTGDWAIDMGDCFPSAIVIGTDLSPIQPTWIPPNVRFYIEDAEDEWTFDGSFDLVHGRMLAGSITDWHRFFKQAYEQLRPGGWVEMNEVESRFYSDDAKPRDVAVLRRTTARFEKASTALGKPFNVSVLRQAMHDAGFVDIQEEVYKIPIGTWPANPILKNLGHAALTAAHESVEPYMLALGTRVLGESAGTIHDMARSMKHEISKPHLHLYTQAHFIWGRKP
ncbi:S-adenosyl-L-methionine-dependent methyltransferase [Talaromyces proteolyticus]|uniref:S-adenosyl-L-methionine-dependent methyltransferase n=1 Tax=Talaromyces proteolyticus TaxID=1131652 RepID=A0AAD4KFS1_9EURO|nr:S-adenosyl-L-methionine-dependent methyltransferase [Talaromyces proteolyticus]KAH8690912.1 S-adenosyl-L-methionine-dependent methyltransferase [Talaromyces proteolyticus]